MRSKIEVCSFWLLILVFVFATQQLEGGSVAVSTAVKRMCFHCHSPHECAVGFCYGDYCVKSLVGEKFGYASKGCENRSTNENIVGCTETAVFGVPNTICYCNNVDFCNFSPRITSLSLQLCLFVLVSSFVFSNLFLQ
ncbi:hypothetical protein M3Y94_01129400 [Aphelenchoides besseyi]|nr:hypothetical protein M3Y94_01129400 [Aphelenchoides besseyi]